MGAVPGLYPNEDAHTRLWWPRLTPKCTHLQNHNTPLTLGSVKWPVGMKGLMEREKGYASPKKPLLLSYKHLLLYFMALVKKCIKRG